MHFQCTDRKWGIIFYTALVVTDKLQVNLYSFNCNVDLFKGYCLVFNATFNYISVISWREAWLMKED